MAVAIDFLTVSNRTAKASRGLRFVTLLLSLAGFVLLLAGEIAAQPFPSQDNPAGLGPVRTFGSRDRLVFTYYFYWYDVASGTHMVNADGSDALTDHPASLKDFSYKSVAWHKKQLTDMMTAGIDVVLPVYWGIPIQAGPRIENQGWSIDGLTTLVQAAVELTREGKRPPRIGMFYDTTTLKDNVMKQHIDLTTVEGKRWFYATVRDFFSQVPAPLWAMIDNKPIVFLYSAGFARNYRQDFIDFARTNFARDFGGRVPYIIRENSWKLQTDNSYSWGGAVHPTVRGVAALGPGYDHSRVPGRTPLVVSRANGRFYETAWLGVLHQRPTLVVLETWNEFHEGTDICESREYGRYYIERTRYYADIFKKDLRPIFPKGKFTNAPFVEIVLGRQNQPNGLIQVEAPDGRSSPGQLGGLDCRIIARADGKTAYLYFAIDNTFKWSESMVATIEVEYFDRPEGKFFVQYDSNDLTAALNGTYKQTKEVALHGHGRWKVAYFKVEQARLRRFQNQDTDFRLGFEGKQLAVRRVRVRR